ncbi:MAG TPA: inositol monophosphatase family protein [Victivallales bacterium]|nr:inositol monophosphatase family protein [Victivallales bacterium]HPO90170.1 inositol monophosphatase family protein [Victivallales bacterium]HRR27811.1 inositol monophosphatase family protein [Victivallales bacterium]HRU00077.1 inositol monophosphatase family protein [Victivallales bacterium]
MKNRDITFISEIAKTAGAIAQKMRESELTVSYKSEKDLVSEADREVEKFIISEIKKYFPDDGIWGEETGKKNLNSDFQWIIDPIDGTTSYLHNQPFYSVSIGLQYKGESILGVVFAPALNELFYAEKSAGAFLNGKKISVSRREKLIESVLSTGFACVRSNKKNNNIKYFSKILPKIREIRRFGSAAIDLSYTACGRLDGFWELNLQLYDICAGALILLEAGGQITDFSGKKNFPQNGTLATNGLIHDQLIELLNKKNQYKKNKPRILRG